METKEKTTTDLLKELNDTYDDTLEAIALRQEIEELEKEMRIVLLEKDNLLEQYKEGKVDKEKLIEVVEQLHEIGLTSIDLEARRNKLLQEFEHSGAIGAIRNSSQRK